MTKEEAGKLIAVLFSTYPNATLERRHIDAYVSGIIDLPADAAGQAVDRLRRTAKFLPSVAEIREAATAQRLGARKTGTDAYGELLSAVRRYGQYPEVRWVGGEMRVQSPWPPLQPDVLEAMRRTWGTWEACCGADGPEAPDRARFIEAFENAARVERDNLVSGQRLPSPGAPGGQLR